MIPPSTAATYEVFQGKLEKQWETAHFLGRTLPFSCLDLGAIGGTFLDLAWCFGTLGLEFAMSQTLHGTWACDDIPTLTLQTTPM